MTSSFCRDEGNIPSLRPKYPESCDEAIRYSLIISNTYASGGRQGSRMLSVSLCQPPDLPRASIPDLDRRLRVSPHWKTTRPCATSAKASFPKKPTSRLTVRGFGWNVAFTAPKLWNATSAPVARSELACSSSIRSCRAKKRVRPPPRHLRSEQSAKPR